MQFLRVTLRRGLFRRVILSALFLVGALGSKSAFAGDGKSFQTPIEYQPKPTYNFTLMVESAQMFNIDNNPNRYYFMTQMISLAWEPFRPFHIGPQAVRVQILSTVFASAIIRGPETFYLGWGPQLRFIFPLGNTPWSLYGGGGAGLGYANANPNAKDDHGLGEQFTFILLGGGGLRYEFNDHWSVWCGILWHHLSNANLSEPRKKNIGPDELGVNAGIGWAF